jgi:hypothetical protein
VMGGKVAVRELRPEVAGWRSQPATSRGPRTPSTTASAVV